MYIYIYKNVHQNYLSGDYYFAAECKSVANLFAKLFEIKYSDGRPAYQINLVFSERIKIKPGFLPLNRCFKNKKPSHAPKVKTIQNLTYKECVTHIKSVWNKTYICQEAISAIEETLDFIQKTHNKRRA